MDPLSLGFVAIVILLGGVIAFLADRLGRYLGKKRLSIAGLRPRHTAEVLTLVAGILIPLFTVLIIMAASEDVRTWVWEGRVVRQQRDAAISELEDLRKEADELKASRDTLQAQINQSRRELDDAKIEVTELGKAAIRLQATVKEREAEIASLTREISTKVKELEAKQRAVQVAQNTVAVLQRDTKALEEKNRELYDENDQFEKDNEKLDAENKRLQTESDTLLQQNEALNKSVKELTEARTKLSDDLARINRELAETQYNLDKAEDALIEKQKQLTQVLDQSRLTPMIVQYGTEIARLPVDDNLSYEEARNSLTTLLRMSRVRASEMGAKQREDYPEAGLFPLYEGNKVYSPEEQEEGIVRGITGKDQPFVLIAYARVNTFQDEPLWLEVRGYPNNKIYSYGDAIAEVRVDARKEEEIIPQLNELFDKISQQARRDRMIPVQGSDQPFGSLSAEEASELVERIKNLNRPVKVIACAAEDTMAAGPLKLFFKLR